MPKDSNLIFDQKIDRIIKQAKVLPTLQDNTVMLLKYEALWNPQGEVRVS
jgi:hypothetical protein